MANKVNIQFMTEENAVYDKHGDKYYVPDFEELIRNASCQKEIDAILKCKKHMDDGIFPGFTFQIVFTQIGLSTYPDWHYCWQVMQHPWYKNCYSGERYSKERMVRDVEELVERYNAEIVDRLAR